jgi:hypothetical protein
MQNCKPELLYSLKKDDSKLTALSKAPKKKRDLNTLQLLVESIQKQRDSGIHFNSSLLKEEFVKYVPNLLKQFMQEKGKRVFSKLPKNVLVELFIQEFNLRSTTQSSISILKDLQDPTPFHLSKSAPKTDLINYKKGDQTKLKQPKYATGINAHEADLDSKKKIQNLMKNKLN